MKVPHLSRQLVLEAAVRTSDGAGGYAMSWQALGTVWAEMTFGTGREAEGEEVRLYSAICRITLRAAPQGAPSRPIPGQRLRDDARIFMIEAVTECDAEGRFLICHTKEESPV